MSFRSFVAIVASALFALSLSASSTEAAEGACAPMVPGCFNPSPPAACSTCCCSSTNNVEFYQQGTTEPACNASRAIFQVKFVGTRSPVCNPGYSPNNSLWSPATGISHKPTYELWEACMRNASPGVALVSQTGMTSVIEQEYASRGDEVLDTFTASLIPGAGVTTANLTFDCAHQYASAITMLVPSLDRLVGVSLLRLCDGATWKRRVKICGELFSTATKSERVAGINERNSVQYNNCSFGYFEFTFLTYDMTTSSANVTCPTGAGSIVVPSALLQLALLMAVLAVFFSV